MKDSTLYILVLVFVNLIFLSQISAQKIRTPQVEIYLSLNHTKINPTEETAYYAGHKSLIGFGIGVKYYVFASKRINFIPGFEYNQYRFSFDEMSYSHYGRLQDVRYYLQRFSVPIALRYNWGKKIRIFAQAGVYAEIINDTRKETYPNQFPYLDENHPGEKVEYSIFSETDYGYHFGIGSSLPISKYRLSLLLEYRHGLNQMNNNYEIFKLEILRLNIGFVF